MAHRVADRGAEHAAEGARAARPQRLEAVDEALLRVVFDRAALARRAHSGDRVVRRGAERDEDARADRARAPQPALAVDDDVRPAARRLDDPRDQRGGPGGRGRRPAVGDREAEHAAAQLHGGGDEAFDAEVRELAVLQQRDEQPAPVILAQPPQVRAEVALPRARHRAAIALAGRERQPHAVRDAGRGIALATPGEPVHLDGMCRGRSRRHRFPPRRRTRRTPRGLRCAARTGGIVSARGVRGTRATQPRAAGPATVRPRPRSQGRCPRRGRRSDRGASRPRRGRARDRRPAPAACRAGRGPGRASPPSSARSRCASTGARRAAASAAAPPPAAPASSPPARAAS